MRFSICAVIAVVAGLGLLAVSHRAANPLGVEVTGPFLLAAPKSPAPCRVTTTDCVALDPAPFLVCRSSFDSCAGEPATLQPANAWSARAQPRASPMAPNPAFNRTPGHVSSFFRAPVAGRRLT